MAAPENVTNPFFKKWKIIQAGSGMEEGQVFQIQEISGTGKVQVAFEPPIVSETDWQAIAMDYHAGDQKVVGIFVSDLTGLEGNTRCVMTIDAGSGNLLCDVHALISPIGSHFVEDPGDWEAQEEG